MCEAQYVVDIALGILEQHCGVKIRITTCPGWRMYWCDGHNEDMVSYWHGGYMLMVVTVADMGKRAA